MPRYSVVVPVYNAEEYVHRSVASILAQTFTDFEVFFVDDLSTDRSMEVLSQYKDPRIRLLSLDQKGGAAGARNKGMESAAGEWFAFLDADDAWHPEFLERVVTAVSAHPKVDFVWCDFARIAPDGTVTKPRRKFSSEQSHEAAPIISKDVFRDGLFQTSMPCMGAYIVTRQLIERVGLFPVGRKQGEDSHFNIRLGIMSQESIFIPEVLMFYYTGIGVMAQFEQIRNARQKRKASEAAPSAQSPPQGITDLGISGNKPPRYSELV